MPRGSRLFSESGIYHVMSRGNERKTVFYDEQDKQKLLDILAEKKGQSDYYLYAYCLMDNHVHLLLKEGADDISRVMKRINTSYARYFNEKYDRIGHVFQDRYKSEVVEDEQYLLALVRYIHYNPLKAGIVDALPNYRWSSYNNYSKKEESIVNQDDVLQLFANKPENRLKAFHEFHRILDSNSYLDYDERKKPSEDQLKKYITSYLEGHSLKEVSYRNSVIKELRDNYNMPIRQIAKLLGVDRGVVQRISVSREPSP